MARLSANGYELARVSLTEEQPQKQYESDDATWRQTTYSFRSNRQIMKCEKVKWPDRYSGRKDGQRHVNFGWKRWKRWKKTADIIEMTAKAVLGRIERGWTIEYVHYSVQAKMDELRAAKAAEVETLA